MTEGNLISTVITVAIMLFGFVSNALYLSGKFSARLENNEKNVKEIKDTLEKVVFKDTCKSNVHGIEGRLDRLETADNGRK